ncbi:hypothetical protein PR048_004676 [Dryococelus australis]|uniref:Integrase catalytic domain-containing protein n=1 Tax=Dryococelus australis TaxID=614101 RepID=A0ABQ9I620_9NEOP|nr:hypothetical protein PR048_004676 [Dryococelus australis]
MAFGKISELYITEPNRWPQYKVRFSFFAEASKITDVKQLRATFLMVIGELALALLTLLITPKELVDPTDTVAEFVVELKRLSGGCNFQDPEKQLLIRIVCGVKYERLQHPQLSRRQTGMWRLYQLHSTRLNMFAKEVVANWRTCKKSVDSGRLRREHTSVNEDHYGTLFNVNLSIDQVQGYKIIKGTDVYAMVTTKAVSRPGILKDFMEQLLSGLQGVAVFLDDVVIAGSSIQEHDERLKEVLHRMTEHVRTTPYHPASNSRAERGVQMAKNALRQISGQNVDCELPRYLLMQRNTPRLSTGKSMAELLVGRCLRTVFDSDKWKPAVVLTTGQMCYKILQENGVVAMRHVNQLRDRGEDDGKLDPPPHRLLPPLPPAVHAGNDCPLAMEEGTAERTRFRALFLGSRRNAENITHLRKSSRREPQGDSYLSQG